MAYDIEAISKEFQVEVVAEPYGNGHINDTYVVDGSPRYILQSINVSVFKDPDGLMENICGITEHIKEKLIKTGGNPNRETLTVIKTKSGKAYYKADETTCFRMYKFIDGTVSYDTITDPVQLYHAAKAFGKFQKMLADYPAETLHETIVNFHNTVDRFRQLHEAINENKAGRLDEVKAEIEFALQREKEASVVIDGIADGTIPIRVTHNDTKLNNVMMDEVTGEGVCVIDLDTVMPGSLLYDFGDALRFAGSSGAEDETDLDKIWFNLECYEQFTKGFLEELKDTLTPREAELLSFSVKLMTLECGIRFLADYLNGDTYFKIHHEKHNLDRCRTQFKLVQDIEGKILEMDKINARYL